MTTVPTWRLFGSCHRYYQGPGALDLLGTILETYGRSPLIVADAFVLEMLGARIGTNLTEAGLTPIVKAFGGEITYSAIEALGAALGETIPGVAVGIGGGKSLDAAKAVAKRLSIPVVTVPTIASNDSPTSGSIAIYDDNHVMISVDRLDRSPDAVIVDTALIAAAPIHFLRAGIGDALSKKFEADGCFAGTGLTPFGTRPTRTAIAIADACYRTLRAHGKGAIEAAERKQTSDDFEAVVEATILMSGLGFENGGLSLAHSLTRGLVKARGARNAIHGDHVSWGLLVQLAAEDRPESEILELLGFYREVGLPSQLDTLGMARATPDEIAEIARWTMTAPHLKNLVHSVDADMIATAINRSEALARTAAESR